MSTRSKRYLHNAPETLLKFSGTPVEVGGQIWERMCNPAVRAVTPRPEIERAQLYAGILAAALGSMAADFGHEKAMRYAQTIVDSFALMDGDFPGSMTQ